MVTTLPSLGPNWNPHSGYMLVTIRYVQHIQPSLIRNALTVQTKKTHKCFTHQNWASQHQVWISEVLLYMQILMIIMQIIRYMW